MKDEERVHQLIKEHRTRTSLAKRCVRLERLLTKAYEVMKTMDDEWNAISNYETVEEVDEVWDLTARNSQDLLAMMTELEVQPLEGYK